MKSRQSFWTIALCAMAAMGILSRGRDVAKGASPFEVLYRFAMGLNEPSSGLVQGEDDAFYGTTIGSGSPEVGTIYRFAEGRLTTVGTLSPGAGRFSGASLVLGENNTLWGTTGSLVATIAGGTVFQATPSGTFSIVHQFKTGNPATSLLRATDGNLYGIIYGQSNSDSAIFRCTPSGDTEVLHVFKFQVDGTPNSLNQAPDNYLYGTTIDGGGGPQAGTVFRLSLSGEFSVLYTFQRGRSDEGRGPVSVTAGTDGNLYGTTSSGGTLAPFLAPGEDPYLGTVFRLTGDKKLTTLHRFNGADGAVPLQGLVVGGEGSLYGTTSRGGSGMFGTIFKVSLEGKFSTVYNLTEPGVFLPLVKGRDGNIYGVRTGARQRPSVIFRVSVNP